MKPIILFCFALMSFGSQAKTYLRDTYIIVSDKKSESLPPGSCRIVGTIHNGPGILSNAMVSNIDRSRSGVSNTKGEYSFLLSASDTSIFFFKEGFNEQVIWSYDFRSGYEVRIDFYSGTNELIQVVDKPVIYLYSVEEVKASISPNFKGDLIFTYPKLNNQWDVTVKNNVLTNFTSSKQYPYLFWEGELKGLNFDKVEGKVYGNLIDKNEVTSYLEESLSQMNFSQKEKSDFITFWAPKMLQNNYIFIQFVEDESVDNILGELEINPQPDNLKRVYMICKGFENKPSLEFEQQTFQSFDRSGFTVIEWGGTKLITDKINL